MFSMGSFPELSGLSRTRKWAWAAVERYETHAATSENNPVTHAKMYALAEYYGILGMKATALAKFQQSAKTQWDTELFAEAAHIVLTTTVEEDKGLRDILVATISKHMRLVKKPEFKAVLLQHNSLAYSLLDASMRSLKVEVLQ